MSDIRGNKAERWINIRKMAALDIVFHGSRFVLAEFAFAIILCVALGVFSLINILRGPDHPLFTILFGLLVLSIALNYMPLLIYAVAIIRRGSAQQEVAFELEHKDSYTGKYSLQSMLLVLPLVVLVLALSQELQKRT